jgi:phosphohistidine phosphatase
MELLIIRHGTAEPHGHPGGDGERALVEKGREQARKAGRCMRRLGLLPELVLTSPLLRARQTAEEFCSAAGIDPPVVQGWLACGMDPETATGELAAYQNCECVAVVGHEPDLSELVGALIGANAGRVRMKKGAVACVRLGSLARHGELQFLLPPKLVH